MVLVQRTRFGDILKLLSGWRGESPGAELATTLQPIIDVSVFDPLTDDGTLYWFSNSSSIGPTAANFTALGVQLNPSVPANARAIVDGFYIRPAVAAQVVNFGLATPQGLSQTVAQHSGNFLNGRNVAVGSTLSQSSVLSGSRTNAASAFALAPAMNNTIEIPAGAAMTWPLLGRGLPGWVLTPGLAFFLEPSAVNLAISGFMWGRMLGDQT